jgi:hypothetical protein
VCGGLLTEPNGVIDMRNETRGFHWFNTYPHLLCEWNITVRVGRTIAVEFPVFSVPSRDTSHCTENYIVVSDMINATCISFHSSVRCVVLVCF